MRIAYVEVGNFDRSFEEVVDFYLFKSFNVRGNDVFRRFLLSKDPSIKIYGNVERIESLSFIKDYDEVVVFGSHTEFNHSVLICNNRSVWFRVYDSTPRLKLTKVSGIFRTENSHKYPGIRSYRADLSFSFGFIRDSDIEYKRSCITIDMRNSSKFEVNAIIKQIANTDVLIKHEYTFQLIGSDLSENQLKILEDSGYNYKTVESIDIHNFEEVLSSSILFIDPSNKVGINPSILSLVYRYEAVAISPFLEKNTVDSFTEDRIKELLVVKHLRETEIANQIEELKQ